MTKPVEPDVSVIIPTLQRSSKLEPLVAMYVEHPRVAEVIVINNAPEPLPFGELAKVRVIQQQTNIFVNPAWNLGASLARGPLLLISNDDILISPRTVSAMAAALRWPIGMVGMDASCRYLAEDRRPWFIPATQVTHGYGTLMAIRKANYEPVPEDLLIWYGDNWLFGRQRRLNLALRGMQLDTKMSETVKSPGLDKVWGADVERFSKYAHDLPYADRFRALDRALRLARGAWSSATRLRRTVRLGTE